MEFKFDYFKSLSVKKLFCIAVALIIGVTSLSCPLDVLAAELMNNQGNSYYFYSYTNGDAFYTNGDNFYTNGDPSYTNGDASYTNGDAIYTGGDAAKENQCGDNVYWFFDDNTGELVISGEGDMWNYQNYNSPFFCNPKIESVVFEKGVTSVGAGAFQECYYIKNVILPDSITAIGDNAFTACCILENIELPKSVTSIGDGAFSFTDIKSLIIPDGVTAIGAYTFQSCSNLTEVIIPDSVSSIGYCAFSCCSSLKKLTIPQSVSFIDECAFEDCFNLKSIVIPDGVEFISNGTFIGCNNLSEIVIPDSVTGIGDSAFTACGFSSVALPDSITSIGDYAFNACYELTSITIPKGVKTISSGTFCYCVSLSEIIIPYSVTLIDKYAFSMCDSLTDVYYQGSEDKWNKISIKSENNCLTNATIHFTSCSHEDIITYPQKNATCTESGLSEGKYCKSCGVVLVAQQVIPAIGHTFTDFVVAAELSCEANYKKLTICHCGVVEEVTVASEHIDKDSDKKCDNCSVLLSFESEEFDVIVALSDIINKLVDLIKRALIVAYNK